MLFETYFHVLINVIFSVDVVMGALENTFVKQRIHDLACGNSSALISLGTVGNVIACGRTCSLVTGCRGFYFNAADGACWASNQIGCQAVANIAFYRNEQVAESQCVSSVDDFSSQFDTPSWSANQITGPPNVYPAYGNNVQSWAPLTIDAFQFIEVRFATAVYITGVDIYETDHCGAVWRVSARDSVGQLHVLWETASATVIYQARIFSPPFTRTTYKSALVRLDVDQTASNTYIEIDAVALNGREN